MDIRYFDIDGPALITPRLFEDARGHFFESFRVDHFADVIEDAVVFVQDNQSLSLEKGTVRGLHFQAPPHAQGKLVRCTQGEILDIAVDIRAGSPTYLQHVSAILSAKNRTQLWVPPGFAHGFVTRTDDTAVQYKCTAYYHAAAESALRWNDPALGIDWGISESRAILSDKDAAGLSLANFSSPFEPCS